MCAKCAKYTLFGQKKAETCTMRNMPKVCALQIPPAPNQAYIFRLNLKPKIRTVVTPQFGFLTSEPGFEFCRALKGICM